MTWDWDKLQNQRQRRTGQTPPNFDDLNEKLNKLKSFKFPSGKVVAGLVVLIWLLSGIYIVQPDEVGVVTRFGAYNRLTTEGPHYHIPFPVESVLKPKVTMVRRLEVGYRSMSGQNTFKPGQTRLVPEESLMLTGDENIVDVQFTVQYQIKDAVEYLFNVAQQDATIKNVAEASMREVIGHNKIDSALTTGKSAIQTETRILMQQILDSYKAGVRINAVQLQDVHPPAEVVDAFKDVASAREDKSRYINEAEAYRNDLLPKTRGQAAAITNSAVAYKESAIRRAKGESARFLDMLAEYEKAKDVTRTRLYLETWEHILGNPDMEKLLLSDDALKKAVPYLPLNQLPGGTEANGGRTGAKGGRQ